MNNLPNLKPTLADYRRNIFSQKGEDGILEKILECIGVESKTCLEFGAWDGFHLSNTAHLWSNQGWKGLLIEGDKDRYSELLVKTEPYGCICVNNYVGVSKANCLEAILRETACDLSLDVLSIDIDGNDYHIFKSLKHLKPRVVIIEYNASIPLEMDLFQAYDLKGNLGASVASMTRIAGEKGYFLAATTNTNCFFVRNELAHCLKDYDLSYERIISRNFLSPHLASSYKAKYIIFDGRPIEVHSKKAVCPWGPMDAKYDRPFFLSRKSKRYIHRGFEKEYSVQFFGHRWWFF